MSTNTSNSPSTLSKTGNDIQRLRKELVDKATEADPTAWKKFILIGRLEVNETMGNAIKIVNQEREKFEAIIANHPNGSRCQEAKRKDTKCKMMIGQFEKELEALKEGAVSFEQEFKEPGETWWP